MDASARPRLTMRKNWTAPCITEKGAVVGFGELDRGESSPTKIINHRRLMTTFLGSAVAQPVSSPRTPGGNLKIQCSKRIDTRSVPCQSTGRATSFRRCCAVRVSISTIHATIAWGLIPGSFHWRGPQIRGFDIAGSCLRRQGLVIGVGIRCFRADALQTNLAESGGAEEFRRASAGWGRFSNSCI